MTAIFQRGVAQSVEHRSHSPNVMGSSPIPATNSIIASSGRTPVDVEGSVLLFAGGSQ